MSTPIVGPVLADVSELWRGQHFVLATAYYSAARLRATTITTPSAEVLVRLDLNRPDEWISRSIAPDALLAFFDRHSGVDLRMYCAPFAHAKVYLGDGAFLVGSANYTVRGFSGLASEMMWRVSSPAAVRKMRRALAVYRCGLQPLTREALEKYVMKFRDIVEERQASAHRSAEDVLPPDPQRPPRVGSYDKFLTWLTGKGAAAEEVRLRGHGKGNLSGHIRMNFYGLRQFLLAYPRYGSELRKVSPEEYRLAKDVRLRQDLRHFVTDEAANEGGLVVSTWRTYLPEHSGGRPKSGGGTQGNLNRMLPLMARFLRSVT